MLGPSGTDVPSFHLWLLICAQLSQASEWTAAEARVAQTPFIGEWTLRAFFSHTTVSTANHGRKQRQHKGSPDAVKVMVRRTLRWWCEELGGEGSVASCDLWVSAGPPRGNDFCRL